MKRLNYFAIITVAAASTLAAQEANPTQRPPTIVKVETITPVPIFRIEVVSRSTPAVNYLHRDRSTKIDFAGTTLMPDGKGSATVESQRGVIHVSAEFKDMAPPSSFGPEYLTYVLWAVSPDGRPVNMGELTLSDYGNGSHSELKSTSELQTFGMIVTAEPYYAVTQPSDAVVLENVIRNDTRGVVETINAKYELLPRGVYSRSGKAPGFTTIRVSKKRPFELYEAENAVQLARVAGADHYASDSFTKAAAALDQALRYQEQKPGQKPVITMAREAVERAEDSRVIALRAARAEAQENERLEALARENSAKAKADEEARQRALAEAERTRAEAQRAQADAQRAQAEADRAAADRARAQALSAAQTAERERRQAELAKAEADKARQAALDQQQLLAADAAKAHDAAERAENEKLELRRQLLAQFNAILQTRDSARGLIVNMSDVLFDTGRYSLKPGAREKLAKVAGIIEAHPGLRISIEGHTDSVGSDEYNMKLSKERAEAVRSYLASQGVDADKISAEGFGKTRPVASNSTAAGRQANRRVEMVVSGEILGVTVGELRPPAVR
jgi:outer membrane protein OmpA-like peptidoglycan-associated protein